MNKYELLTVLNSIDQNERIVINVGKKSYTITSVELTKLHTQDNLNGEYFIEISVDTI